MIDSPDFDAGLRTMLLTRADDITLIPDSLVALADSLGQAPQPQDSGEPEIAGVVDLVPHGPVRRHWLPLAAAAAVVALLAGVLTAVLAPSHRTTPTPPVGPSTSHPAPALKTVVRKSCRTTFPAQWKEAAGAASVEIPYGRGGAYAIAVTASGGVIYEEGNDTPDTSVFLTYVAPGSHRPVSLGGITLPLSTSKGLSVPADVDGGTAVITIQQGIHTTVTTKIVALDLATHHMTTVADLDTHPGDRIISQAYVLDGRIYYETQHKGSTGSTDRVWSYDVATATTTKVAGPAPLDLGKSAAGIVWNLHDRPLDRPAAMPAAVASHVTANTALFFVSDGTSWAWVTPSGDLEWYGGSGDIVRVPGLLSRPFSISSPGVPLAVAGPYVQYQVPHSSYDRIIDVRTGGTVPASVQLWGAQGTLIGDPVDVGTMANLMRVDTATLPELTC